MKLKRISITRVASHGYRYGIKDIHKSVQEAHTRIKHNILRTSLIRSHELSELIKGKVYLKCENEQYTGSFKARGSLNKILSLSPDERSRGIVTASTGNHALGFARALDIVGAKGTIFLPHTASKTKIKKLNNYPVELVRFGDDSLSTEIEAKRVAEQRGSIWVSPYNDVKIITGQGTIALEIAEELEHIDCLLATVGGGGLISGIGSYLKIENPNISIIGCQPENSPEMTLSLEAGKIVGIPEYINTLSDGSAGGIEPDAITFGICQQVIVDTILVSEDEIKDAIRLVVNDHKKIIEGAAAVAVASLIKEKEKFIGQTVVVVLCGANIETKTLVDILNE